MLYKINQTMKMLLSGDAVKYARTYRRFLLFLVALAMIYITNGLLYSLEKNRAKKNETELLRQKAQYNVRLEERNKLSRYNGLIELLKKNNLSGLKISGEPPVKVEKR